MSKIREAISNAISKPDETPEQKEKRRETRGPKNWRNKDNALKFAEVWLDTSLKTEDDKILVEDLAVACEKVGLILEPNKGVNAYKGGLPTANSINNYLERSDKTDYHKTIKSKIVEDAKLNNVPDHLISALLKRLDQIKKTKDKDAPPKQPVTIGANVDWVKAFIG
tara:strand:+ start:159 stop:659 length:501 start_codon:yes stop_codon:yes gene_type:complete